MKYNPIQRAQRAEENFFKGYNCAQAVALAFADAFVGLSEEAVLSLCSGFGGGMGRLREVCGAFSACVMVAGFVRPALEAANLEQRGANYALVQELAGEFKKRNAGSIICRELLGLQDSKTIESPMPSPRTAEYYHKRPCAIKVYNAALLLAETLNKQAQ